MENHFTLFYIVHPTYQDMLIYLTGTSYSCPNQAQKHDKQQNAVDAKQDEFFMLFKKQVRLLSSKYRKKAWTEQQDQLLMSLRSQNVSWAQICQEIPEKNAQACKRRYQSLKKDEQKWPFEFEQEIKSLYTQNSLKWQQKIQILLQKFPNTKNYTPKMIKDRYLTYLQQGIEVRPWTVEEDLHLVRMLRKGMTKWKLMAKQMPGRNELHLKNRYYGCLRKIWKKVQVKLSSS